MPKPGVRAFFPVTATLLATLFVTAKSQNRHLQQAPAGQARAYHSVWEGVYTEKQAQRGEALYHEVCSSCHGDKLTGKESENAPALTGEKFETEWKGRTVGDLFRKILRKNAAGRTRDAHSPAERGSCRISAQLQQVSRRQNRASAGQRPAGGHSLRHQEARTKEFRTVRRFCDTPIIVLSLRPVFDVPAPIIIRQVTNPAVLDLLRSLFGDPRSRPAAQDITTFSGNSCLTLFTACPVPSPTLALPSGGVL